MKIVRTPLALAVVAVLAGTSLAAQAQEKPKSFKAVDVVAVKAASAPKLDGMADDAVWKSAPVVKFSAVKGANFKDGKVAATKVGALSRSQLQAFLDEAL